MIASGGVVGKLMLAQRSLLLRRLIYHLVCASKEGRLFLYGAATPPVQEGKLAHLGGETAWRASITAPRSGGAIGSANEICIN